MAAVAEGEEPHDSPDTAQVGPYAVLRRLNKDGTGRTYLARSPGGRLVVITMMREDLVDVPGQRERFRVEAAAVQRVSGAFTAPVIAADADAPRPWLVTAYVDAPSLADLVTRRGPLPQEAVRRLTAGMAEALASLHDVGVAHGNVKPSNVLMAVDGPRLVNLGIARADSAPASSPGHLRNTPPAPSGPERGGRFPADLYALGALLCFASTGAGPFDTASAHTADGGQDQPAAALGDISDPLVRKIAEFCLAQDPSARPSPRDVLSILDGAPYEPGRGVGSRTGWRQHRKILLGSGMGTVAMAAVALALALGASGPAGGNSGFAWSVRADGTSTYFGIWAGSGDVVLGDADSSLTAYDAATGSVMWRWSPPTGDQLCSMSASTDHRYGAFVYGRRSTTAATQCDQLQIISANTGKLGWKSPVRLDDGSGGAPDQTDGTALTIGSGIVTAQYYAHADDGSGIDTDLIAVAESTGRTEWSTDFGQSALVDGCQLSSTAGEFAGTVYAIGECGEALQEDLLTVTGSGRGDVHLIGRLGDCTPLSLGDPAGFLITDSTYLVAGCSADSDDELYAVRAGSTELVQLDISMASDGFLVDSDAGGSNTPAGLVMQGAALYLPDQGPSDSASSGVDDAITAIDLAAGTDTWTRELPGNATVLPLAATGSAVEAITVNSSYTATKLAILSTLSGAVTSTRALDAGEAARFESENAATSPPHGVVVGSTVVVWFPNYIEAGDPVLGAL